MKKLSIGLLFALLAGGCASEGHTDYSGPDAACVSEGNTSGAYAHIAEVDGLPGFRTSGRACFTPGVHRLRVSGSWHPRAESVFAYMDWTFEAGRHYEVLGYRDSQDFHYRFRLVDVTGGKEIPLSGFEGDQGVNIPLRSFSAAIWWTVFERISRTDDAAGVGLSAQGPRALEFRDKALQVLEPFAVGHSLLRADRYCPYGAYGLMHGDQCASYLNRSEGMWLIVYYSAKDHRSTVIFTGTNSSRLVPDVKEQFNATVVSPLREEFGSQIHCWDQGILPWDLRNLFERCLPART